MPPNNATQYTRLQASTIVKLAVARRLGFGPLVCPNGGSVRARAKLTGSEQYGSVSFRAGKSPVGWIKAAVGLDFR